MRRSTARQGGENSGFIGPLIDPTLAAPPFKLWAWPCSASPRWATRCCRRSRRRSPSRPRPEIRRLAADMQETLEDIGASGARRESGVRREARGGLPHDRLSHPEGLGARAAAVDGHGEPGNHAEKRKEKTPVWERCLSVPGLHGKVPRFLHIEISYLDLDGRRHTHEGAQLLGGAAAARVRPPRRHPLPDAHDRPEACSPTTRSPGRSRGELAADPKGVDPLFIDLVERWPGRQRWFRRLGGAHGVSRCSHRALPRAAEEVAARRAVPGKRSEDHLLRAIRDPRRPRRSSSRRSTIFARSGRARSIARCRSRARSAAGSPSCARDAAGQGSPSSARAATSRSTPTP